MGIAMCHFDLSARESGFTGDWNVNNPQIKSSGMEYIVSWIAHHKDSISTGHQRHSGEAPGNPHGV